MFTKKILLQMGFHKVKTKLQNTSIVRKFLDNEHTIENEFIVAFTTKSHYDLVPNNVNLIQCGDLTLQDLIDEIAKVQFNNGYDHKRSLD